MTQSTDAELVKSARTGNTIAFGQLVQRYKGLVYALAYHQIGNYTDAQDIAQEVFVKAFRSIESLEKPERFIAWLKVITNNECKMTVRGRRQTMTLDEAELSSSYAHISEQLWKQKQHQLEIQRAVDSLPEKSRLTITLHYLSGLSHQEIGEFLDIPANGVAQQLHRARRQLKDILLAEIEEDYEMNKLPESFTEEVLARLSLYPIKQGYFMTADGDEDTRGIIMAVGEEAEKAYITLWMKSEDLDEIILGTLPARTSEKAKGRALDTTLHILEAFGIKLERVVLRLAEDRRCRADIEFMQGDSKISVDMRPSDAMGLAIRAKAAICIESSVVQKGNVGEDDAHIPDEDMDPAMHDVEFERIRKSDTILDKAFEMISIEDLIDTIRFRKDEANGVLRMWLEADAEREVRFEQAEYEPGINMIFDMAQRRGNSGKMIGDQVEGFTKRYKYLFSMHGDDARMRVIAEATDHQVDE